MWPEGLDLRLVCGYTLIILHTAPPDTVTLTDELGPELGTVLQAVELSFDCDFSNVLVVNIKWSLHPSSCTSCTVDMTPGVSDHYNMHVHRVCLCQLHYNVVYTCKYC